MLFFLGIVHSVLGPAAFSSIYLPMQLKCLQRLLLHFVTHRRRKCHTHENTYLGSVHADDAIAVTCAVIKIGNSDSLLAGGNPVLLGGRIDLEDMGPGGVDRLLPGEKRDRQCFS